MTDVARTDSSEGRAPEPGSEGSAVLRAIWSIDESAASDVDELCGDAGVCRNMRGVSFEAMVEQGTDLRTAWREQLARDGKLDTSAGTIGDLVSGRAPGTASGAPSGDVSVRR
ncbi:hypothetical protein [Nocardioides sp. YIM 152588]|uniref:hypothetical protein n=1 Tax=Nocardioides sp. YIM 152588 TaxID=3158259 RepID=UPI0032E49B12